MKKGDFGVLVIVLLTIGFMLSPWTKDVFYALSKEHPYLMGFSKFAVLATVGELLAIRLRGGKYKMPNHLFARVVIWGCVGILIVFFFGLYEAGVRGVMAKGLIPDVEHSLYVAFLISAIMNGTFGIAFMGAHRISDAYLDNLSEGKKGINKAIERVDWNQFLTFIVGKTIPFFWIPAHTITFLLPPEYRVLVAALLSIALGLILSFAVKKK